MRVFFLLLGKKKDYLLFDDEHWDPGAILGRIKDLLGFKLGWVKALQFDLAENGGFRVRRLPNVTTVDDTGSEERAELVEKLGRIVLARKLAHFAHVQFIRL